MARNHTGPECIVCTLEPDHRDIEPSSIPSQCQVAEHGSIHLFLEATMRLTRIECQDIGVHQKRQVCESMTGAPLCVVIYH